MDPRARMLRLLALLQSGRAWSADELAEALGTTSRTLRRDVDFLRDQGDPVRSAPGPGGHYRLTSGRALPPLVLDDDEAVAVALGLRLAAGGSLGVALEQDAAERALAKLRRMLPSRLAQPTDALLSAVEVDGVARPLPAAGSLRRLAEAAAGARVVQLEHAGRTGSRTRRVEPYRLVALRGQWYLFCWDLDRGDWRAFRLDRIAGERETGAAFVPRALPSDDLPAHLAERFRAPASITAVLDLGVSASVAAGRLHRVDGVLEALTERSCRYTAVVDSFEWLAMVLVVSEVEFTVREPAALARYLSAAASRFARATS